MISCGDESNRKGAPRAMFWNALLEYADAGGVHFNNNKALRRLVFPEGFSLRRLGREFCRGTDTSGHADAQDPGSCKGLRPRTA